MINAVRRYSLLSGLLILLIVVPNIIQAQEGDDLSEEEIAVLEQFIEARQIPTTYTSAVVEFRNNFSVRTIIEYSDHKTYSKFGAELEFEGFIISRETDGFDANGLLAINEQTTNEIDEEIDEETEYLLENEAVMVDGVLYLRPEYLSTNGDVEKLDEGIWTAIEGSENIPSALSDSSIETLIAFFNNVEPDDASNLIFSDVEMLKPYVTHVSSEKLRSNDDKPLGHILIQIADEQFTEFVQTHFIEPYWDFDMPVDAEHIRGILYVGVGFNDDGLLDKYTFRLTLYIDDVDLHALDANEPENSVFNMRIRSEQWVYYTDIKTEVEPVVPE